MRRNVAVCVALFASLAVSLGVALQGARAEAATTTSTPPGAAQQPAAEKVSYCHRTASVVNPYNLKTTAVDSIVKQGHGSHTGPVFPEEGPDGKWGDIIPPFDYDNGNKHFPGLNWPAGSAVLEAGCAVHETIEPPPVVTKPTINVNVSCRSQMNLDVTFNEAPGTPWTLLVTTVPTGPAPQPITLVDNDSDLMGFHPVIPAAQLPQVSYTWSVDATNAGQTFTGIALGSVVCQTDTTTSTVAATTTTVAATTTTKPATTTPGQTTTTVAATTTTKPATTTPGQTTTTVAATTTTKPATTTPGQTTTTGLAAGSGSTTTDAGVTTTTAGAGASGSTTTTSVPSPTGTPPPTAAPTPLDPPPVDALGPGEVLSDPPPPVEAFVVVPGNKLVVLGVLSPEQVRALFHELSLRKLAHTGNDTSVLVLVASLTLLSGGALIGLARRPRRRADFQLRR